MKNRFYSLLFLSAFMVPASVQATSVEDAVIAALNYHPSIEAASQAADAAEQDKREQKAGFFPEVTVSAQTGRMFADNATSRGLVTTRGEAYSNINEGSISLTQPVFDGFSTMNLYDASKERKKAALLSVSDVKENIALRAAQAYLEVMRARSALKILYAQQNKLEDFKSKISAMVNEGAADDSELKQAEDMSLMLLSMVADFEGQLVGAEAQYLEAIGNAPSADMSKPLVKKSDIPETPLDAVNYAKNNHALIQKAMLDSRAAKYDSEAERAQFFPTLDAELSYLKSEKREEIGGESEDARAVLKLGWNMNAGGAEFARVQRSKHKRNEAAATARDTRQQVERDVRIAFSQYKTAEKRLEVVRERVRVSQDLFRTYQSQFEAAKINQLQLMQADFALFNVRLEALNTEYSVLGSQYAVLASMGRLKEALSLQGG